MSILSVTSDNRPSIFIACSKEGMDVASAVKSNFDYEADVDIWHNDINQLNKSTLDNLRNSASFYDYAIIVFTPDDQAVIRGEKFIIPRDNLLFEAGLFVGSLGFNRAFIIAEEKVKLPSDLNGIEIPRYRERENLTSAVGRACDLIKKEIEVSEKIYRFSLLPSTALAIGYYENFLKKVEESFKTSDSYSLLETDNKGNIISETTYKILNRRPIVTILLPKQLSDVGGETIKIKKEQLKKIRIGNIERSYPLYINLEKSIEETGPLKLYDIPTTLFTSKKTIDQIFDDSFLMRDNNLQRIERREIVNFEKTIRKLMPDRIENNLILFDLLN